MTEQIKKSLYSIFAWYFRTIAKCLMVRHKPTIIAITGTVGKTTTKDIIVAALRTRYGTDETRAVESVRGTIRSQNSDLTTPLSILGFELNNGERSITLWLGYAFGAFKALFAKKFPYYLVLEVGAGKPDDVRSQAQWLKPNICVFTALSETPVHVEFFESVQQVYEEKKQLALFSALDATLIYPEDDQLLMDLLSDTKRTLMPVSMDRSITLHGVVGEAYARSYGLAIEVCRLLDIDEHTVQEHIDRYFDPAPGRMRLLKGINDSRILDDSYNASPIAVENALNELRILSQANSGRALFLFGDMKELGMYSEEAHGMVGKQILDNGIDMFVAVGEESEYAVRSAIESGYNSENIHQFHNAEQAGKWLSTQLQKSDLLLAKGSRHSIHLESALKHIVIPEDVPKLVQEYL